MNMTELEQQLFDQVRTQGGCMNLDLTLDAHCEYFMWLFGGPERMKAEAPLVYHTLLWQRQEANQLQALMQEAQTMGLVDQAHMEVDVRDISSSVEHRLTCNPTLTLAQLGSSCSKLNAAFVDDSTHNILMQDTFYPEREEKLYRYTCQMSCIVRDQKHLRYQPILARGTFVTHAPVRGDRLLLGALLATSPVTVMSCNGDVEDSKLEDPVIKKTRDAAHHPKSVCISYQRDGQMQDPDYHCEKSMEHDVHDMEVYLPVSFTVTLKPDSGAFFYKEGNCYFSSRYKPKMTLSQFLFDAEQVVKGGEAVLQLDWQEMCENHDETKKKEKGMIQELAFLNGDRRMPNKLKFTFPENWGSQLHSEAVMDIGTGASLYGYLPVNTQNKNGDGQLVKGTTVFFIKQTGVDPSNKNEMEVKSLYFQWGCIAKNVRILTHRGEVLSQEVQVGDQLIGCGGRRMTVVDVLCGQEEWMLRITTAGGTDITLTEDHPVAVRGAQGSPEARPACEIQAGAWICLWDASRQDVRTEQVDRVERVDYQDMVYNFELRESDFLVANGVLVGDLDMQRRVRAGGAGRRPEPVQITAGMQAVIDEMERVKRNKTVYPGFQPSDRAECLQMHYFAVYILASRVFGEKQSQLIAQTCQYLGDQATTGGLTVSQIPEWCRKEKLFRIIPDGFQVPVIPTAMQKWYDQTELNQKKRWFDEEDERTYDVKADILRPYHFPMDDEEACVRFCPGSLEGLMKRLEEKFEPYQNRLDSVPEELLVNLGVLLHLLIDSKLHEHFCAGASWPNMIRRISVTDAKGIRADSKYPAFCDYDDSMTADEVAQSTNGFPAGLQKMGWPVNETCVGLSYEYPLDESSLGDYGGSDTWGYYSSPNYKMYARACGPVLNFIERCGGLKQTESWSLDSQYQEFVELFQSNGKTLAELSAVWKQKYGAADFSYSAQAYYQALMEGDSTQTDPLLKYAKLFHLMRILVGVQQGKHPEEIGLDTAAEKQGEASGQTEKELRK